MFAGKKSAQIREILISESAWEEMTCLFAPSLAKFAILPQNANSRMFKPLWQHGRAICFADGWFEWKREGDKKQPYFTHRKDGQPILMAAIGSTPFERGDEAEGFLIVTAAADKGLIDIHDRRPLVLVPDAAREWMKQDVSGKESEDIAADGAVSADHFVWHPVTRAVGNVKNQGPELIEPVG